MILSLLDVGTKSKWERELVCLCTWLTIGCYWRPGEPLKLQVSDAIRPVPLTPQYQLWSFRLNPHERGQASKTNCFDDSVVLDKHPFQSAGTLLHRLTNGRRPNELLLDFSSRQWCDLLNRGLENLR